MRKIKYLILDKLFFLINKIVKKKKTKVDAKTIKKVLIIKYCCIGDVLMTTPLIKGIKQTFPKTKIDYCVGEWSKEVLKENKSLNRIFIDKKNNRKELKRELKNKYDLIFILDLGISDQYFAYSLKPKILAGLDSMNRGFLLNYKMKHEVDDNIHETDAYLGVLESLGYKTKDKQMEMILTKEEKNFGLNFIKTNNLEDKKMVGIFPGGGHNPGTTMNLKQWGSEKYAELVNKLTNNDFSIILFGGKTDKETIDNVKKLLNNKNKVIDASIKYNLRQSSALISTCDLFISNDSGPMHIASALGVKTISIFGPTNANLLKPLGKNDFMFYTNKKCTPNYTNKNNNHDCHPCYRQIIGDFNYGCQTKDCMKKILVEDVEKKVYEILQ